MRRLAQRETSRRANRTFVRSNASEKFKGYQLCVSCHRQHPSPAKLQTLSLHNFGSACTPIDVTHKLTIVTLFSSALDMSPHALGSRIASQASGSHLPSHPQPPQADLDTHDPRASNLKLTFCKPLPSTGLRMHAHALLGCRLRQVNRAGRDAALICSLFTRALWSLFSAVKKRSKIMEIVAAVRPPSYPYFCPCRAPYPPRPGTATTAFHRNKLSLSQGLPGARPISRNFLMCA